MIIRTKNQLWQALSPLYRRTSRISGIRLWAVIASVGLVAAACDNDTPTGPDSVANIVVAQDITLQVGQTHQFAAVATNADGDVVTFVPEWSVEAGGGTINSTGMFTAGPVLGVFPATIQAANGTITGTATVTIIAGAAASLEVMPGPSTVGVNGTQLFTVVARDSGGNVVVVTPTWSVVNGGGTINSTSGQFTASGVTGTYTNTIRATSGTLTGTATVNVVGGPLASIVVTPGVDTLGITQAQQFTAVGRDAAGNIVAITPTWAVVNGGGTIAPSTGLFTAGSVLGTYTNTVQATSGLTSGTATVEVVP